MVKVSLLVGLLLLPTAVSCDTLTLSDYQSLNGRVSYSAGEFTVSAIFTGGVKEIYSIPRTEVKSLEINQTDFNPGAPPFSLSGRISTRKSAPIQENPKVPFPPVTRPPQFPPILPAQSEYRDVVTLNSGEQEIGTLTEIERKAIALKIKNKIKRFARREVHSVKLDSP